MRQQTGKFLESCRVTDGPLASTRAEGFNGAFKIPPKDQGSYHYFTVVCSNGGGWEHVSVSLELRCPTWEEMCWIKSLFWDAHECVVQFHPPEANYVNNVRFCLHLWKPTDQALPQPPAWMVGIRSLGVLDGEAVA